MKINPFTQHSLGLAAGILLLAAPVTQANYWGYNNIIQNQTYQIEVIPRICPNNNYWAVMSASYSIGGYGGIQQGNGPSDRRGLFSIWDSSATTQDAFVVGYNPYLTYANYTFRFGGEGAGSQLAFAFAWQLNQSYRMAWRRFIVPGSSGPQVRYAGYYYDGNWVWCGTIQRPQSSANGQNMNGFEGFSEDWAGTGGTREIDIRNVWCLDLNNNWVNITHANMTDNRDNGQLWAIAGGWRHHSYDPAYAFQSISDLPMGAASGLAPVYIPYYVNCGANLAAPSTASGDQVASSINRAFEGDAYYSGGSAGSTASAINVSGVANAAPARLYQTYRQGSSFTYTLFGLKPNTTTTVLLHFSEPTYNTTGSRTERIVINGATVESSLDIRSAAGAMNKALVKSYTVTPGADGKVTIAVTGLISGVNAILCGIEAGVSGGALANGTYKIIAVTTGNALDCVGNANGNGVLIDLWPYWSGPNQKWNVTSLGNGYYSIINPPSGRSLDCTSCSPNNGTLVELWDYWGGACQQWAITPTSNGAFKISTAQAKSDGTYDVLDGQGCSGASGAQILLWSWGGGGCQQQWYFQTAN